jgi:hypothetical protein
VTGKARGFDSDYARRRFGLSVKKAEAIGPKIRAALQKTFSLPRAARPGD